MFGYDWIYVHIFIRWYLYLSFIYFTFLESILLNVLLLLLLLLLLLPSSSSSSSCLTRRFFFYHKKWDSLVRKERILHYNQWLTFFFQECFNNGLHDRPKGEKKVEYRTTSKLLIFLYIYIYIFNFNFIIYNLKSDDNF